MASSEHRVKRQPCRFAGKTEKRLADYLLAASTAGVSVLALAQPADAKIVYTSTHKFVHNGFLSIDLNNDGKNDFTIVANSTTLTGGKWLLVSGSNFKSDAVARAKMRSSSIFSFAVKFNSGSSIGGKMSAKVNFFANAPLMTSYNAGSRGFWVNSHGYLGLRIKIDGEWHYGWARLQVQRASALLTGYAYETIANKPIKAGATTGDSESGAQLHSQGSLGALALGAPGLALWRREESAAVPSA